MMHKIQELVKQIESIEADAGQLAPTDYEGLYKLLAVAYFAAKDIIVLQQANLPVEEDKASKAAYTDVQDALDVALEEVRVLTHWKNGANLEGEQLAEQLKELSEENGALQERSKRYGDISMILHGEVPIWSDDVPK